MAKKFTFSIVFVGIILIIMAICLGYFLYTNYYLPSTVTLPPPLANVEFPLDHAQYPTDWPDELKFPSDFVLVDFSSGTLPDSTAQGWAAKLRYQGYPLEATKVLSSFLEEKEWAIIENIKLDSGGASLLIQHQQGSGIIVIDANPNDNSQTLIVSTIFP